MRSLSAIACREFASYFRASIGWVVIALFLLLCGLTVALTTIRPGDPATMRDFFGASHWLLLLVAPAVSMRLLSEEQRTGTLEPLMTAPVSDWHIGFGKYLGAVMFMLAMLAPTLAYVIVLELIGGPDYGPILAGYTGLVLVGMLYLAVGLLASSLTPNQIVAYLGTLFFFMLTVFASAQGPRYLGAPWDRCLGSLSISARIEDFARGVIDTEHVVFFVACAAWFVVLTVCSLEFRRWK